MLVGDLLTGYLKGECNQVKFAAPEQKEGKFRDPSGAGDIYQLGMLWAQLIKGH